MECPKPLLNAIRKLAVGKETGKERQSIAGLRREYGSHGYVPVCNDASQIQATYFLF